MGSFRVRKGEEVIDRKQVRGVWQWDEYQVVVQQIGRKLGEGPGVTAAFQPPEDTPQRKCLEFVPTPSKHHFSIHHKIFQKQAVFEAENQGFVERPKGRGRTRSEPKI